MGKKYTGDHENCNHTLSPAMKEAGAEKAGGVADYNTHLPCCHAARAAKSC